MRPFKHYVVRIAFLLLLCYFAVKICYFHKPPTKLPVTKKTTENLHEEPTPCKMHSCFNYSLCPLNSGFPVHVYNPLIHPDDLQTIEYYFETLARNLHVIKTDEKTPCLYVVTIYEGNINKNQHLTSSSNSTFHIKESMLKNLPFWGSEGKNHIIINLSRKTLGMDKSIGMAMVAQPTFTETGFRPSFDIIMPIIWPPKLDEGSFCPPIKPASRRYLLSFQGSGGHGHNVINKLIRMADFNASMADKILIQLECFVTRKNQASIILKDWALCDTARFRRVLLEKSTFVLIPAPVHHYITTRIFQLRLYEALKSGAIPVLLGGDRIRMPFEEVLDWRRATLMIPEARVSELIYLLSSINDDDLLEFRQQGRKLWELYFSSLRGSMDSVLAIIRSRLMIPAPPVIPAKARPGFNHSFTPPKIIVSHPVINQYVDEPPPIPVTLKTTFIRNFTTALLQGYKLWNDWGEPFVMYPQLPWDPVPADKEKLLDSVTENLIDGSRKAVAVFEKFTVIISSYKRQTCLKKILLKLRGLPFLDKVVVIWNDRIQPENMTWPEVGVPLLVIRPIENYQQNRFMPYFLIETEAVYLQDDDLTIRHSDIISAYRVWREHRDRIVGFFASYHDGYQFFGETSYRTSMISTGAAFIHRYYLWAYWRLLPTAISDHVDVVGRCDDIAMNFLVSHITKKPPIQVPFNETNSTCNRHPKIMKNIHKTRDYCLKYFSKIMGYTPLLYTRLVVDLKTSVRHETSINLSLQSSSTEAWEGLQYTTVVNETLTTMAKLARTPISL